MLGTLMKLKSFECRTCTEEESRQENGNIKLMNAIVVYGTVETFCYFGDMLSANGGCEHIVIAIVSKRGVSSDN